MKDYDWTKIFYHFLVDEGILFEFLDEENHSLPHLSLKEGLKEYCKYWDEFPSSYITQAIAFHGTKKGTEFWAEKNRKWQKRVYKIKLKGYDNRTDNLGNVYGQNL